MSNFDFKYRLDTKVGEGSYGIVYRAYRKSDNKLVAVKQIRAESLDEGVPYCIIREIAILKELDHENIIKLLDTACHNGKLYIVFEYMETDLQHYIKSLGPRGRLTPIQIKSYMYQALVGLAFCHKRRLFHRDLKPQNLLLESTGKLKLADFGMSRTYSIPMRTYSQKVVTLWYRAPEILMGCRHYSVSSDMWSMGCILAEMARMTPLFPGDSEVDTLYKIFRVLGTPPLHLRKTVLYSEGEHFDMPTWPGINIDKLFPHFDPLGLDLVKKMLIYDPNIRITAIEAIEHPYFADIHKIRNSSNSNILEVNTKQNSTSLKV